jgi:hypothetical protein
MKGSPEQQKTVTKRRLTRSKGTVEDLSRVLWQAVREVQGVLLDENPLMKLKAAHALGTVAGAYLKSLEVGELEARLTALEEGRPHAAQGSEVTDNDATLN